MKNRSISERFPLPVRTCCAVFWAAGVVRIEEREDIDDIKCSVACEVRGRVGRGEGVEESKDIEYVEHALRIHVGGAQGKLDVPIQQHAYIIEIIFVAALGHDHVQVAVAVEVAQRYAPRPNARFEQPAREKRFATRLGMSRSSIQDGQHKSRKEYCCTGDRSGEHWMSSEASFNGTMQYTNDGHSVHDTAHEEATQFNKSIHERADPLSRVQKACRENGQISM